MFQLNGITLSINRAEWLTIRDSTFLNGQVRYNRWVTHRWTSNVMTVAQYQTLFDLEGRIVSIMTTDYKDRNLLKTYYLAELRQVQGTQQSVRFIDVLCEFLVRI